MECVIRTYKIQIGMTWENIGEHGIRAKGVLGLLNGNKTAPKNDYYGDDPVVVD